MMKSPWNIAKARFMRTSQNTVVPNQMAITR